jgi:hypothetical protein
MTTGRAPQAGQGVGQPDFFWLNGLAGGDNMYVQTVTALAGGGQVGATVMGLPNAQGIQAALIRAKVVNGNDSCQLPQAIKGLCKLVYNSDAANSMNVYANPGTNKVTGLTDTINGAANANAYAIAHNVSVLFFCPDDGIWAAIKSA